MYSETLENLSFDAKVTVREPLLASFPFFWNKAAHGKKMEKHRNPHREESPKRLFSNLPTAAQEYLTNFPSLATRPGRSNCRCCGDNRQCRQKISFQSQITHFNGAHTHTHTHTHLGEIMATDLTSFFLDIFRGFSVL